MNPGEAEPGDAAWRFAGHWLTILGIVSLIAMPAAWLQGKARFDLGWVLLFWHASALFRRSAAARWLLIVVSIVVLGAGALLFVASALGRAASVTVMGARNPAPDLAAVALGAHALLALPPLMLLLREDARRLAGIPPGTRPRARLGLIYFTAISLLLAGSFFIEKMIRRESMGWGGTVIQGSQGQHAWTTGMTWSDGGGRGRRGYLLYIVSLAGEASQKLMRDVEPHAGTLRLGDESVRFSPPRSWILRPPPRRAESNVILIDESQRVRRLPRHVTLGETTRFEAAFKGFKDSADLERRLLSVPPD